MNIGDSPIFRFRFRDRNSDLVNPSTVGCWVEEPDGAIVPITATVVSIGIWEAAGFSPTKSGEHWIRVEGSGAIKTANEKRFVVAGQKVVHS